jgi:hypothetical protein
MNTAQSQLVGLSAAEVDQGVVRAGPTSWPAGPAAVPGRSCGLAGGGDPAADRSAATLTLFIVAAWALALVARPYTWWRAALVAAMVGGFVLISAVPFAARFFALTFADPVDDAIAAGVGAAGALVLTAVHRWAGAH